MRKEMKIIINQDKLQSVIWYSFIVVLCFSMFLNVWNYYNITHLGNFCGSFINFFDQTKESYGCLYTYPTLMPMINALFLSACLIWEIIKLNEKHGFIVLKKSSEKLNGVQA